MDILLKQTDRRRIVQVYPKIVVKLERISFTSSVDSCVEQFSGAVNAGPLSLGFEYNNFSYLLDIAEFYVESMQATQESTKLSSIRWKLSV